MAERIRLFYKAAENQTDVMIRNILGQGMDNHLLGLRQLAKHIDSDEAAAVFQDPSFQTIHHFALSTSQVFDSSPPLCFFSIHSPTPKWKKRKEGSIFCIDFFLYLLRERS